MRRVGRTTGLEVVYPRGLGVPSLPVPGVGSLPVPGVASPLDPGVGSLPDRAADYLRDPADSQRNPGRRGALAT
jgi:hypothetical protein